MILTTSLPSCSSGSGFQLNRRDSAALYLKALGGGANHWLACFEQEDELSNYERLCESRQATMVYAVMNSLMLRRLAPRA